LPEPPEINFQFRVVPIINDRLPWPMQQSQRQYATSTRPAIALPDYFPAISLKLESQAF